MKRMMRLTCLAMVTAMIMLIGCSGSGGSGGGNTPSNTQTPTDENNNSGQTDNENENPYYSTIKQFGVSPATLDPMQNEGEFNLTWKVEYNSPHDAYTMKVYLSKTDTITSNQTPIFTYSCGKLLGCDETVNMLGKYDILTRMIYFDTSDDGVIQTSSSNTTNSYADAKISVTDLTGEVYVIGQACFLNQEATYTCSEAFSIKINIVPLKVWTGDYEINNQEDMDAISGYNIIDGELRIMNTPFTNLAGLESLFFVTSHLRICFNDSLTDLTGLENLSAVNASIVIGNNKSLTNLTGLENLIGFGGLQLISNQNLITLTEFDNLTQISGQLNIYFNPELQNLNGLDDLKMIQGNLTIQGNTKLCNSIITSFENQILSGNGITGVINISGNKDC